jgi:hypothetical protein
MSAVKTCQCTRKPLGPRQVLLCHPLHKKILMMVSRHDYSRFAEKRSWRSGTGTSSAVGHTTTFLPPRQHESEGDLGPLSGDGGQHADDGLVLRTPLPARRGHSARPGDEGALPQG